MKSESKSLYGHKDGGGLGLTVLDENEERDTGVDSDEKEEVSISMLLKEDAKTTVSLTCVLSGIDDFVDIHEEVRRATIQLGKLQGSYRALQDLCQGRFNHPQAVIFKPSNYALHLL